MKKPKSDTDIILEDIPRPRMIKQERRTGRTTRLADKAIQTLFTKGTVIIKNHNNLNNNGLYDIVFRRLDLEHKNRVFIFDRDTLTISIKLNQKK